jgi:hypothetical protein
MNSCEIRGCFYQPLFKIHKIINKQFFKMDNKSILQALIFVLFAIIFTQCNENQNYNGANTNYYDTGITDSSLYLRDKFIAQTPRMLSAELYSFNVLDGKTITTFLNPSGDTIITFDGKNALKINIPFKFKIPISSVYFHNYDSIFVFLDREFVVMFSNEKIKFDDFILINSKGKVLNKYSLSKVKDIYNGQLCPMIYLKKTFVENIRILNGKLFLPFSIYNPLISDSTLKDYYIKLICEYDLLSKKYRMLNISFPKEDIGKIFSSNVHGNSVDFYLLNDSILIYTFDYSSTIYKYNLNTNMSGPVYKLKDFYFENRIVKNPDTNIFYSEFYCPVFVKKDNIFIRRIKVHNYKQFEDFEISQIFNDSLKIMFNNYSDSTYSSIRINANGDLIVSDKSNSYISSLIKISKDYQNITVNDDDLRLKRKIIKSNVTKINADVKKLSLNDRLKKYIYSIGLQNARKVVLINTDIMCSHCIEYIMTELKNNEQNFQSKNVFYLFYGENIKFSQDILETYKISNLDIISIDETHAYLNYLNEEEYVIDRFVVLQNNQIKVFEYFPDNLKQIFDEFIEY